MRLLHLRQKNNLVFICGSNDRFVSKQYNVNAVLCAKHVLQKQILDCISGISIEKHVKLLVRHFEVKLPTHANTPREFSVSTGEILTFFDLTVKPAHQDARI